VENRPGREAEDVRLVPAFRVSTVVPVLVMKWAGRTLPLRCSFATVEPAVRQDTYSILSNSFVHKTSNIFNLSLYDHQFDYDDKFCIHTWCVPSYPHAQHVTCRSQFDLYLPSFSSGGYTSTSLLLPHFIPDTIFIPYCVVIFFSRNKVRYVYLTSCHDGTEE